MIYEEDEYVGLINYLIEKTGQNNENKKVLTNSTDFVSKINKKQDFISENDEKALNMIKSDNKEYVIRIYFLYDESYHR